MVGKKRRWGARCKTWHMLGENCPEATPTQEAGGENFLMGWTIAWILIQGQVQSQVLAR